MLVKNEAFHEIFEHPDQEDPPYNGFTFDILNYNGRYTYFTIWQRFDKSIGIYSDRQSLEYIQLCFDQIIDNAKYHDKEPVPKNWGDEQLNDMDLTSVKITEMWQPFKNNNGGIEVSWGINDFGFGTTTLFMSKEGKMVIDAERLPYDFAKWIFRKALANHWGENV